MKTYEVAILGQRYKVRSDEDEQYIHKLAEFVNGRVLEAQLSSKNPSSQHVAILAALSIADSLFKQSESESTLRRDIRGEIESLLGLIRSCGV